MKTLLWLIIFLFSIVVTGCNGDDDSTPQNDPGTNSSNLPPAPGDAGKATLEGIDSDSDGVRDDVQIAIYERYPTDEQKRTLLTQKAKALQEAVVAGNSSDTNTIIQASKLVINAVDCLHEKLENPSSEISFLEDKVINTHDRSEAYIKFNEDLSGQFFGDGDTENLCQ